MSMRLLRLGILLAGVVGMWLNSTTIDVIAGHNDCRVAIVSDYVADYASHTVQTQCSTCSMGPVFAFNNVNCASAIGQSWILQTGNGECDSVGYTGSGQGFYVANWAWTYEDNTGNTHFGEVGPQQYDCGAL